MVEGILAPASPIGAASFTISPAGTLAYVPYSPQGAAMKLVWVDREGGTTEVDQGGADGFELGSNPRLSPDNKLLAIQANEQRRDIWLYSMARGTMIRLTHEGINSKPAWTPDGNRVVYQSNRAGRSNLFWQPTHGRGPEEPVTPTSAGTQYPGSFTPDGRVFLYSEIRPGTGRDIFLLPMEGDRTPQVYIQTPYDETTPRFSPDGRYVAYVSDESGRNEVYVQPFTGSGVKYRISVDGGAEVVWGETGEIFYRSGSRMMAVQVRTEPSLEIRRPQLLFEGSYSLNSGRAANYDVSADGQRFLMLKREESQISAPTLINIVQNWSEELKQKVPVE
jgi:serine/threonine-protein kinase